MRLLYFYYSNGACSPDNIIPWSDKVETKNHFACQLWTEGRFQMLKKLVEEEHVDEVIAFIDSTRSPGVLNISPKIKIYVVPHLNEALKHIKEGDVIYARGGFKPWYGTLQTLAERKHWIMFYRANTNRHSWPFWDVILDDLVDKNYNTHGRLGYAFSKPINEEIFYKREGVEKVYDVMIGASHIHVKKGQHLTVKALIAYKNRFGTLPKSVLTGGFIRSYTNNDILKALESKEYNITYTGMQPRTKLAELMNQTKLFVHLGPGGQNDRGVLEAMACGVPVLIASPKRFSPFVSSNPKAARVILRPEDANMTANILNNVLREINDNLFDDVADYYLRRNGMKEVVVPKMVKLLDFMKKNPIPNREKLLEEFV